MSAVRGRTPPRRCWRRTASLAARDGIQARLIDPRERRLVPVRTLIQALAERCRPHAAALGCLEQFDQLGRLVEANGADRQRAAAGRTGLTTLVATLADRFSTEGSD